MDSYSKGPWTTLYGIALTADGIHVADVKGLSRTDDENEANARRIVVCVNACDGYTTEQLEALAGGNVKREVVDFADKLSDAENRYLKAEAQRDTLLAALKDLVKYEGTTQETGIGVFPSDELGAAVMQAQAAIDEIDGDTRIRLRLRDTPGNV